MSITLVFVESQNGKIKKASREALALALSGPDKVAAVTFANDGADLAAALSGVSTLFHVTGAGDLYQPDIHAATLESIIKDKGIATVIAAHSARSRDLFPRVAARVKAAMVSDCVAVNLEERCAVKPVYSGKLLARIRVNAGVNLFTLRPNVFPAELPAGNDTPEVVAVSAADVTPRCRVVEVAAGAAGRIDLTEAAVIVSGGRAMKNKDNFALLQELADVLNAGLGASRAAVDAEFAEYNMQVGQTGKVVNPKLYVACGISGAIQHFVGMKTSKVIVAINKDPEAPIFKKADYGIVGDLFEIVPLLKNELEKALN
ncbi:MAG TPA: electron transfer flavoprotein subunit alpha/FixB family protein [Candidatus Aminicenantes bacterium]|nr:electron transfer flavoprotein subunit alpha/FixB family protein [Candidatus Aminicenantes bacterium]